MDARPSIDWLLALLPWGGAEIILILALFLILLGARKLTELARALSGGPGDASQILADLMKDVVLGFAQGFGAGRIPGAPGTFGSLVGLLWFALLVATGNFWLYLTWTILGFAFSVWCCGLAEPLLNQTDPPSVVLDEIVAIPVCFLPWTASAWIHQGTLPPPEWFFTSTNLVFTSAIFVLFRTFDIVKPWPIRQSQRLPGGWGVTVDDVLAALGVALITLPFVW